MKIEYKPIGIVHSPFKKAEGVPIQPKFAKGVFGTVELFDEYTGGLKDIGGFSHIILLYHLHKSKGYSLEVIPFLDSKKRGLFATRAPRRPNPIGLSVVKLISVEKNNLHIECLDIIDGTPVLDIKPYVSEFDHRTKVKIGWLKSVQNRAKKADDRFTNKHYSE